MPVVILVDVSLSMVQLGHVTSTGEKYQKAHLAAHGISALLDHMSQHCRLEFTSVVVFSSLYQVVCPFTRQFDVLLKSLGKLELYDRSCLETGLQGVSKMVAEEWGPTVPTQVVLVTDSCLGLSAMGLQKKLRPPSHKPGAATGNIEDFPLPFPFPSKLHVALLSPPGTKQTKLATNFYQQLVEQNSGEGTVNTPDTPELSLKSVEQMFVKLASTHFSSFKGLLHCGSIECPITLSPPPQPYNASHDWEIVRTVMSDDLYICGFLNLCDVASPPSLSRHLVLPQIHTTKGEIEVVNLDDGSSDDDSTHPTDESKIPSFCVLLHGALKVENMCALLQLSQNWYGILYSFADSKKKSNLMLSTFVPGDSSVQWLGSLSSLGPCVDSALGYGKDGTSSPFPLKSAEKRSYSQPCVVWIRQSGLQSDIQKILRHARKLPEKTAHFYKELNRVRRAALSFGFYELLEGLSCILERECTLLPDNAHPDCAIQLSHVAKVLKEAQARDVKFTVTAIKTTY